MPETAVEIIQFRLIEDVDENEFLAASNIMMKELASFEGFISRELLKKDDVKWVDILYWENMDSALKAAESVFESSLCLEYFKYIKESSMITGRYSICQHFEL